MTTLDGPLDGIRVLDLSALAPGPYCSMLLADMGAEVILIEQAGRPRGRRDLARDPNEERRRFSSYALGRGKRSIGLNLKTDEAREIFHRLADDADVVLEGFRPGVVKRLGVDWKTLSARNPRLVYCSLSGFGQTGPYASHVGHDINYIATGGALGMIGDYAAEGRPAIPVNIIADFAGGGLMAAFAIVCALQARERTGEGQHIDLGMSDGVLSLITSALAGYEGAEADMSPAAHVLNGGEPHYQVYETSDGRWFSVGSMEPYFYANLCRVLGLEQYIEDQGTNESARREEIRQAFASAFRTRTAEEWHELLNEVDVCAKPVLTLEEALRDEHNISRQMVVEVPTPDGGVMRQAGVAPKLSATPGRIRAGAPTRGQDTEALLDALGMDADVVADLREREIVA
ncbi:MAG: CaiB/BaiF CoA-transferase family protein [Chloroflexi bacterium]|nr:CaiB/BaiF CoA-transferase family protein [Chloroflexota bacterium]MCY3696374.1 CaiB/BaiF CoA-transferase family protein [Chloroflexota bacterium]